MTPPRGQRKPAQARPGEAARRAVRAWGLEVLALDPREQRFHLGFVGVIDDVVGIVRRYDVETVAIVPSPEWDAAALQRLSWALEKTSAELLLAPTMTEVTADLLATWPSPWKNESMVNAKVGGRLGSHKHFQLLLQRRRELDEQLGTDSAPAPGLHRRISGRF